MKFLLTGAAGQLGESFGKLFEKSDISYLPTDIKPTTNSYQILDVSDLNEIRSFMNRDKFDVVINCAAYTDVDRAETEWQKSLVANGLGPRNLAIAAYENDQVLIHFSTDYVFDGNASKPYHIYDQPNPISKYGESKAIGEYYVRHLCTRFIVIRTSWLFSPGRRNFPNQVLEWSKKNDSLSIVDDQISSPTLAEDLARTTAELIELEAYGLYHVTNRGHCSRFEWMKFLLQESGWNGTLYPAKSGEFETPAKRPSYSALNIDVTESTIGHVLPDWKTATKQFLKSKTLNQNPN